MLTEKIWGTTEALILTPMFEMHRLIIKPLHRCSFHEHQFKHNAFYVLTGTLCIDGGARTINLVAGSYWTIAPGFPHQFRTGEDSCTALEMYYTEPLSEDIRRFNVGSPV